MSNIIATKMFGQQLNYGHWSTDGLVFYWRGIPAGNAVDESPYGNHGTITGANVTWVGDGLNFNANTDYVDFGDKRPLAGDVEGTILSWVSLNVSADFKGIISKLTTNTASGSSWALVAHSLKVRAIIINQANTVQTFTSASNLLTIGKLHQVVFTFDASWLNIYVDGMFIERTANVVGAIRNNSAQDMRMGIANATVAPINAKINQAVIYNRALSASESQQLYINPDLPMQQELPVWLGQAPVGGTTPKGPLGHPLYGPFAGPIAC